MIDDACAHDTVDVNGFDDPIQIVTLLGSAAVRLRLIRAVADAGPSTVSALARQVGYTRHGVLHHLAALERIGALTSDVKRVPGSDRPARVYYCDRARVEVLAWSLLDALEPVFGDRSEAAAS